MCGVGHLYRLAAGRSGEVLCVQHGYTFTTPVDTRMETARNLGYVACRPPM